MSKHKVSNYDNLYNDARDLMNDVVVGKADAIIQNLKEGIESLKGCWVGEDAQVNINSAIEVHNAVVAVRNLLADLAKSSAAVMINYSEIQNANGAKRNVPSALNFQEKTNIEAFSCDTNGGDIDPNTANNGKSKIDTAKNAFADFKSAAENKFNSIMGNWTEGGTNRENINEGFETFRTHAQSYGDALDTVSRNITTAINNYNF